MGLPPQAEAMVSTLAPVPTEFCLTDETYRARPWWIPASKPMATLWAGGEESRSCRGDSWALSSRGPAGRGRAEAGSRPVYKLAFSHRMALGEKTEDVELGVGPRPASLRRMIRSQDLFLQCEMLCGAGLSMFGESAWGKKMVK